MKESISITLKVSHLVGLATVLVAFVSVALTLHGAYVIPSILRQAENDAKRAIVEHEKHPHPGSFTRSEAQLLIQTIDHRLGRIEAKLDSSG